MVLGGLANVISSAFIILLFMNILTLSEYSQEPKDRQA